MAGSPFGPMFVVVNTRAGRGAMRGAWPSVRAVIEEAGLEYEVGFTERRGHGEEMARDAVDRGIRFVVAVGGDGTVHEVANGMMGERGPRRDDLVLGVIPSGSGSDFCRTFGLPRDPGEAARHLAGDSLWGRVDGARMTYRDFDGDPAARWFFNIAEIGLGGDVVVSAASMPRWLGGSRYKIAALKTLRRFRPLPATIKMNGRVALDTLPGAPLGAVEREETVALVVIANGQFFGGGMRVAPRAIPSDGLLDVLIGHGGKWDGVRALRRMPSGTHIPNDNIAEYLVDRIEISGPRPMTLEADGEPLGSTPVEIEVVPGAFSLKI